MEGSSSNARDPGTAPASPTGTKLRTILNTLAWGVPTRMHNIVTLLNNELQQQHEHGTELGVR
jgi:hypothetical protein